LLVTANHCVGESAGKNKAIQLNLHNAINDRATKSIASFLFVWFPGYETCVNGIGETSTTLLRVKL
jgi:hypothetical protein